MTAPYRPFLHRPGTQSTIDDVDEATDSMSTPTTEFRHSSHSEDRCEGDGSRSPREVRHLALRAGGELEWPVVGRPVAAGTWVPWTSGQWPTVENSIE